MRLNYYLKPSGFSLVEMAMVLVVLGLVTGALVMPLQVKYQQLSLTQTEATLTSAKQALLGYAQTLGRLPCPATNTSNGLEDPLGGGVCVSQLGYFPAATLGIQPTDINGFAVDTWGNRIMYAVAQNNTGSSPDFTSNSESGGMSFIGIANLKPELRVCNSASNNTLSACSSGSEKNYLINNAVAVIYSLGASGHQSTGGLDENANPTVPTSNKSVFVSHSITTATQVNGEFDHIMVWISPYVLYNAMIEAGQLH